MEARCSASARARRERGAGYREPGVFAGCSRDTYTFHNVLPQGERLAAIGETQLSLASSGTFLPLRVSYKLDLKGPSINVQTACSTSLVAVALAHRSLLAGECDLALAGGVSLTVPRAEGALFQEGGILAPDGRCLPFDAAARGTVAGEGVGAVVLKRLADALAGGDTVYAVLRGSSVNNDGGSKIGYLAPGASYFLVETRGREIRDLWHLLIARGGAHIGWIRFLDGTTSWEECPHILPPINVPLELLYGTRNREQQGTGSHVPN